MALYDPTPPASLCEQTLQLAMLNPEPAAARLGITTQQVRNLAQLGLYLRSLPVDYQHLDMSSYMDTPGLDYELDAVARVMGDTCGTTACAVGHGPMAGVAAEPNESWHTYEWRVFGSGDYNRRLHTAMFNAEWDYFDTTVRGAAARIAHSLTVAKPDLLEPDFGPEPYADFVE